MAMTSSTANKAHVVIYSRPNCHLCEEAKQIMQASGCVDEYTLDEINIESDAELLRRYRFDVPVIMINGVEAFRHYLTAAEFCQKIRSDS